MFKAIAMTAALSACATTSGSWDGRDATHARVQLDLGHQADHADSARFPAAIEPRLPSADRIAHRLVEFGSGVATAHVQLCVAPDGHVASLKLERGSMLGSFDQAVMHDAATWHFAAMPGNEPACEHAAITYQPGT